MIPKTQRKQAKTVANALQSIIRPNDVAQYEIAKYYLGTIINMASEINLRVGQVISRATISTDYSLSSSKYKDENGKIKSLSDLSLGAKITMLCVIAKRLGMSEIAKPKLPNIRNLFAHSVIVTNEEGKALLFDRYDINGASNNEIEVLLNNFFDETEKLELFCKDIERKMDENINAVAQNT